MAVQTLKIQGANEDGFQPLHGLRQSARRLGEEGFLRLYPVPALVVSRLEMMEESVLGGVQSGAPQLLTLAGPGLKPLRYLDRVAFLAKPPGNPFPHLISLGRSPSNDLVVALEDVSKLHGYFTCSGGRWAFTDQTSTNGSALNGEVLASGQRRFLTDGDRLAIGGGITFDFLLPGSLFHRLMAAA